MNTGNEIPITVTTGDDDALEQLESLEPLEVADQMALMQVEIVDLRRTIEEKDAAIADLVEALRWIRDIFNHWVRVWGASPATERRMETLGALIKKYRSQQ